MFKAANSCHAHNQASQETEVDDTTRYQLVFLNFTSKFHLNLTLTPILNSSHQLQSGCINST